MPHEGELNGQLAGVVRLLRKEQDRMTRELRGIGAALAAFGKSYGKGTIKESSPPQLGHELQLHKEHVGLRSGKGEGCRYTR